MAINEFTEKPIYTAFDINVPTEADMYAKVRALETNALLAKQQTDQALHDKLGETGDLLSAFEPSKTYTTYLGDKARVDNPSRLYPLYQQKVSDIYAQQQALIDKHADNLSTPEAQRDFNKFQGYLKGTLAELKQIKESDKIRQKSEEDINKSLADSDVGNIGGAIFPYNASMDAQYGLNSQMGNVYNNTPIAGTKVVDVDKKIDDYIGNNKIRTIKDDYLNKLGIKTIADAISVIEDGSTSIETRKRSQAQLKGLADAYLNSDRSEVINNAKQIQYDSIRRGNPLDDQTALKQAEDQVLRRFYQFDINDRKIDRNRSIKQLSLDEQKALGKGIFDITNGLTSMENFVMDNKNSIAYNNTDKEGNFYDRYKTKVSLGLAGKAGLNASTPEELLSKLKANGVKLDDQALSLANDIFTKEESLFNSPSAKFRSYLSSLGNNSNVIDIYPQEGDKLNIKDPKAIRNRINSDPQFKQILVDQGVNLDKLDPISISNAIKNNKTALEKLVKVSTQGAVGEQLNSKTLNDNLNDGLISSTVRTGANETIDGDLKDLMDTKNYSIDGQKFKEYLSSGGKVTYRTDNIIVGSGQNNTSVSLRRTAEIKDKEGKVIKTIPFIQDISNPAINNNATYKALNTLNELISSGQKLDDEFNGGVVIGETSDGRQYKAQLYKKYDPNKKEYIISGDVYDPTLGREIPYQLFTELVTKQAVRDVIKSTSIQGGNESEKQQEVLFNRK